MAKSFCRFLIQVNHAYVAIFNVANMSFIAIRKNKILAKISEFTVFGSVNGILVVTYSLLSVHVQLPSFVWFDSLRPSQQSCSHVRVSFPGLSQF